MVERQFKVISGTEEIPREEWNALSIQSSPIMDWEYLQALEKSGCVSRERGFRPAHIAVYEGSKPIAIAPLYQRDRAWVEFGDGGLIEFLTELTGLPFNSGLVGNIPFTPIPGYDFLHSPHYESQPLCNEILASIDRVCRERMLSTSRIYFVAPESSLHKILLKNGYIGLTSSYLLWFNRGYRSFDEYLGFFRSARRTKIKREWRTIRERGIQMEMVPGIDASEADFEDMHLLYRHTWMKHMGPGIRPFLNESFFRMLFANFRHRSSLAIASLNGKRMAMALFYHKNRMLYGRYWGCFREVPFLHFAACYYFPISYAIENQFKMMDPGFGGEHKIIRGFESAPVSHYIKFHDEKQRRIANAVIEQMRDQFILK